MANIKKRLKSKISPVRLFGVTRGWQFATVLLALVMRWAGDFPTFSNWIPIGKSWNQKKGTKMIPVEDLTKPHHNYLADKTLDDDFIWIGRKNREALFQNLLYILKNGHGGTPFEYTLLMPPLKKARQILSRDAKHRKWNGYIWENI
jgi:hypothetical protein